MVLKIIGATEARVGTNILIDGKPFTVKKIDISKTGKHGHAKVNLMAVGILDDKKRNLVMPGHDKIETPIVNKRNAQVLSISGDTANVMDTETYETLDIEIPEEFKGQVTEGVQILYWDLMGHKLLKQIK